MNPIGVRVGGREIRVNQEGVGRLPVDSAENYSVQFPDRGFLSDSRGEVRCLQAIVNRLGRSDAIHSVLETSSRIGITVPVWSEDLRAGRMLLNNPLGDQAAQLAYNFPEAEVFSEDIQTWVWPEVDLVYADMNTFTLRKLDAWRFIFRKAHEESGARWLTFVDSCCFGFRFGQRASYLAYGPTEEYYWQALRKTLRDEFGWAIRFGCRYDRAALLAADRADRADRSDLSLMEWVPPGDKSVDLINSDSVRRGFF